MPTRDPLVRLVDGDFTMGLHAAVEAPTMLRPKRVVPLYHDTFPLIGTDPEAFADAIRAAGMEASVLAPGQSLDL